MNTPWLIIVLATIALGLPTPALALKVQQAEQSDLSPELLATLSGLEEGAKPSQQEISALINYAKRIQQLGGDPRSFLHMASVMPTPFDVETHLDFTPGQMALVKRKARFQFGPGLLYHGMDNLDGAIQAGELNDGMMLTRVANQWATGDFHRGSPSPAIVVIPTELFNRYLREGRATLKQMGRDIVEPYPTIDQPVPIQELVAGGAASGSARTRMNATDEYSKGKSRPARPSERNSAHSWTPKRSQPSLACDIRRSMRTRTSRSPSRRLATIC